MSNQMPYIESPLSGKISKSQVLYPDLHVFKQQAEEDTKALKQRLYSAFKKSVRTYKMVFFSLGLLFLFLGTLVFVKHPTWACDQLLWSCHLAKMLVEGISWGFGGLALIVSYSLKTEMEAAHHILRQTKQALTKIYKRKKWQNFQPKNFALSKDTKATTSLKNSYHEALDQIDTQKEETHQLLSQIGKTIFPEELEREKLFNQALSDLKDKMDALVLSFSSL